MQNKEVDYGKNIRISTDAWERIREYCKAKGIVMGTFVENCALSKIPLSFTLKQQTPTIKSK